MGVTPHVEIDTEEVKKKLEGTPLKMRSIAKRIMTAVNREVIRKAKENFKNQFNVNNPDKYIESSGSAERTLSMGGESFSVNVKGTSPLKNFKNFNSKKEAFTSYVSNRCFYAKFLENGADIRPKRGDYLTFVINGQFKKVEGVQLPARPYLEPAIHAIWDTETSSRIADETLQKELQKYYEKENEK